MSGVGVNSDTSPDGRRTPPPPLAGRPGRVGQHAACPAAVPPLCQVLDLTPLSTNENAPFPSSLLLPPPPAAAFSLLSWRCEV